MFVSLLRQEDAEENGVRRFYESFQTMEGRTVTGHPDGLDAKPAKQFDFLIYC